MEEMDIYRACSYRLFREHCTYCNGVFVKDMSRLGRRMEDIIIVDVVSNLNLIEFSHCLSLPSRECFSNYKLVWRHEGHRTIQNDSHTWRTQQGNQYF